MSRSNIQEANGGNLGPAGQFLGYFRPPVTSDYSFVSVADDASMVWINLDRGDATKMELIIDFTTWMPLPARDWCQTPSRPCPIHWHPAWHSIPGK
jgi:hypothetical protein